MASATAVKAPTLPYRVGHGFDLHRLAEGYKLIIGGIDIPHTKGCEAHSDGRTAVSRAGATYVSLRPWATCALMLGHGACTQHVLTGTVLFPVCR